MTPNAWQWNITVDQLLRPNTTFELGYVGNTGVHLTSMSDFNAVPQQNWLQSAFQSGAAPERLSSSLQLRYDRRLCSSRRARIHYNSLQALFRSQMGRSTFQAAYTWSHSLGNVELDNSSGSFNQQATTSQSQPGLDKGNTNINRPNIFVANEVFFLPKFDNYNQLVQQSVGGWELNSIFTAAHGSSLSIFSNGASGACTNLDSSGNCITGYSSSLSSLIGTGYSGNNRPLATSTSCNAGEHENQILNSAAFTLVGYALGTTPSNLARRGACFGAPTTNLDAQLAKNWQIHERYGIKFAMDFFDVLNHPNFNTSGLEAAGYTSPSPLYCGGATAPKPGGGATGLPCSPTNNIVTSQGTVTGFGSVQALQPGKSNRELQYSLRFQF